MLTLSSLAALAASVGSAALAGGPIGMAVAWLGDRFASGTVRLVAILIGALIVIVSIVAVTVHLHNIKRDADAYRDLSAQVASIGDRYSCGDRPAHERPLPACLAAIEAENAQARATEIGRQRAMAIAEYQRQAAEDAALRAQIEAEEAAIAGASAGDDGAVPQVLLDSWARERKARGVK
jgi:hypothetical protein